jgi:hypothetical protein
MMGVANSSHASFTSFADWKESIRHGSPRFLNELLLPPLHKKSAIPPPPFGLKPFFSLAVQLQFIASTECDSFQPDKQEDYVQSERCNCASQADHEKVKGILKS